MRQAAVAAARPDEQHVSAPRRGQLAVLTACADAMRDLPLRKIPEEVILASQRRGSGRRFWRLRHGPGGDVVARQGVTGTRISRVTPAGSVIFSGEPGNLTGAGSD